MRVEMPKASSLAVCLAGVLLVTTTSFAQLVVNRDSGAISFGGASAAVNGYEIASASGLLLPDTWNSLADQSIAGWVEANPRIEMLAELNPSASSSSAFELGNAYAGTTVSPSGEDLTVKYSLADGTVVDGTVDYEGAINDFVLRVDPASGAANLELLSDNVGPFDITGYSIYSDGGSLVDGNLSGLGAGWISAGPSSTALSELSLEGSMMFTTNTTASIGNIFTPNGTQDLRFEFATIGQEVFNGSVTYGAGDGPITPVCAPLNALGGDVNGDGTVGFPDFLVLSANFGQDVGTYEEGDLDCNGNVGFPDFLVLSSNFGKSLGATASAAAVPEPATGLMAMLAAMLLAGISRKRVRSGAILALVGTCMLFAASPNSAMALDFDTRMIVLDPSGANPQINSALEARGMLNGTITDAIFAEDVTGTVDLIDFAGGAGAFDVNNPYPNGVNDDTLIDFAVHVSGFLEIPAGDWNIGFNSDDGGILNMPRVEFLTTVNENGATGVPGELIYDAPRGAGTWTSGSFTVPAGGLRTEFDVIMYERSGGDSLEVAVISGEELGEFELINEDWVDFGFELEDGTFDWKLLADGPATGDFNWDDEVDFADFLTLAENYGTGSSFAQGDINGDALVDLNDFTQLLPLLSSTAPAAAAVPEPGALSIIFTGLALLLTVRRRVRR